MSLMVNRKIPAIPNLNNVKIMVNVVFSFIRILVCLSCLLVVNFVGAATANLSSLEDKVLLISPIEYGVRYSDYNTYTGAPNHGRTYVDTVINRIRYIPNSNYCGTDNFIITTATLGGGREPDGERVSEGMALGEDEELEPDEKHTTGSKNPGLGLEPNGVVIERLYVNVNVICVNDSPNYFNITNRNVNEDSGTTTVGFHIGDIETPASSLSLSRSSSNTSLIPNGNITFGGSGNNRTIKFRPAINKYGSTTIKVNVSDGRLVRSNTFIVTVNPINDTPTISNISNRSVNEDSGTSNTSFTRPIYYKHLW